MSKVVICDECGKVFRDSEVLHCADAMTSNGLVYGADICKDCGVKFDGSVDAYGWHMNLKESDMN